MIEEWGVQMEKLLKKIKNLGINEFENLKSLNLMDGSYLNLECKLPNGQKAKILGLYRLLSEVSEA